VLQDAEDSVAKSSKKNVKNFATIQSRDISSGAVTEMDFREIKVRKSPVMRCAKRVYIEGKRQRSLASPESEGGAGYGWNGDRQMVSLPTYLL
jgi:hypothetical protein